MLAQGVLLDLTADRESIYEKRGMLHIGYAHGADGWTPAPAVTTTLVQTVRLSQRYAAPRRTASANANASAVAMDAIIDRWYRRAYDTARESGRGGRKTPQFGEVSGV